MTLDGHQARGSGSEDGLDIRVEEHDRVVHVTLIGELDLAGTGAVEACAGRVLASGVKHLVCDLSELSFVDSTGLASLIELDRLCRQAGTRLWIVRGTLPMLQEVLQVTGLDAVLPLVDAPPDLP